MISGYSQDQIEQAVLDCGKVRGWKMKKEKNLTYDEAYAKLEAILHKIESNELGVEELLENIRQCKREKEGL